jgi:hypothetical protein
MRIKLTTLYYIHLIPLIGFYSGFYAFITFKDIFVIRPFNTLETAIDLLLTLLLIYQLRRLVNGRYWSAKAYSRNSTASGSTSATGSGAGKAREGTREGPRVGYLLHNRTALLKSNGWLPRLKRLPVTRNGTPILAKRGARLSYDFLEKKPKLMPVFADFGPLKVDDDAICTFNRRIHTDPSPSLNCRCGFYAVTSDDDCLIPENCGVTLLVELSGIVIEYDKGYRAQHQRILECHIGNCGLCHRPTKSVIFFAHAEPFDFRSFLSVNYRCDRHAKLVPSYIAAKAISDPTRVANITLDEIEKELGVKIIAE